MTGGSPPGGGVNKLFLNSLVAFFTIHRIKRKSFFFFHSSEHHTKTDGTNQRLNIFYFGHSIRRPAFATVERKKEREK
jgi:hypothetical protein